MIAPIMATIAGNDIQETRNCAGKREPTGINEALLHL